MPTWPITSPTTNTPMIGLSFTGPMCNRPSACPSASVANSATSGCRRRVSTVQLMSSALHAPALHRAPLDAAEDNVFNEQAEEDHGQQAGEDLGDPKLVLVLEDVPAEPA